MEGLRPVHLVARATRLLARLAIGISLFAVVTPATAQSAAPQPQVCRSALSLISV